MLEVLCCLSTTTHRTRTSWHRLLCHLATCLFAPDVLHLGTSSGAVVATANQALVVAPAANCHLERQHPRGTDKQERCAGDAIATSGAGTLSHALERTGRFLQCAARGPRAQQPLDTCQSHNHTSCYSTFRLFSVVRSGTLLAHIALFSNSKCPGGSSSQLLDSSSTFSVAPHAVAVGSSSFSMIVRLSV